MTNFTRYQNCDIWIHKNDVERLGFEKTLSFEEIKELALIYGCPIIVKYGKGKWYLKGRGKNFDEILQTVEKNIGKYPRRILYFIH